MLENRKGITKEVTFNGNVLENWQIFPLPLDDISSIRFASKDAGSAPLFYRGTFRLERVGDTFLDTRGLAKGCVWVNGHNLGRYWYIGPQQTLYLPGVWLKQGENQIVILELEEHAQRSVQGLKDPILNQLGADRLKPVISSRAAGKVLLQVSDAVKEGSFADGDGPRDFAFPPVAGRYVCLRSLSSQKNDPFASVAEFSVMDENGRLVPREKWKIFAVDCEETDAEDGHAENAFDDDPGTIWHTTWGSSRPAHPHYIIIDMGESRQIGGFRYVPRRGDAPGKIKEFKFYVRQQAFEMVK